MSEDKAVIRARGRKDMLEALVMLVMTIGGVYEYQQITAPLDEAIIFLSPSAVAAPKQTPEDVTPQPAAETQPEAFKAFFNYMDKVNEQANQLISYEGSALSHIKRAPEVAKTVKPDTHVFQDGKIEVYDSEKGVVAVVDTKSPRDDVKNKQSMAEEPAKADNSAEEADNPIAEQEKQEALAQQQVQQQVEKELQKVAETGDDAPVVLLPGMSVPAVTDDAEETIDLTETSDEITTDMEKINRAMRQIEELNIEGLVPEAPVTEQPAKLPQTNAEVKILEDDGAGGGVINMLNQITR